MSGQDYPRLARCHILGARFFVCSRNRTRTAKLMRPRTEASASALFGIGELQCPFQMTCETRIWNLNVQTAAVSSSRRALGLKLFPLSPAPSARQGCELVTLPKLRFSNGRRRVLIGPSNRPLAAGARAPKAAWCHPTAHNCSDGDFIAYLDIAPSHADDQ